MTNVLHKFDWANDTRNGFDRIEMQEGLSELTKYTTTVYNKLVDLERKRLNTETSLWLFARLDIGLIEYERDSFSFFVNEVERGWGTNLFAGENVALTAGLIGKLMRAIPEYYGRFRAP